MLFVKRPTPEIIARFLADQAMCDFSYAEVGFTARPAPAGYVVDHSRIALGQGQAIFAAAKRALAGWHQFKLGWVEPCPDDLPIEVGRTVGILAHLGPVWWLNACRIVSCIEDATE